MLTRPVLSPQFQPIAFEVVLPAGVVRTLDAAETELVLGAEEDENQCLGHFPGLEVEVADDEVPEGMERTEIRHDLLACQELRDVWPAVEADGRELAYNFVRLSLIDQHGSEGIFHLDRGAASAVTGNPDMTQQLVWRGLGNLHHSQVRTLEYLDMEPNVEDLQNGSRQYLQPGDYDPAAIRQVELPPRLARVVHFVVFASNRVWHTGGSQRHFVAAFGTEESDSNLYAGMSNLAHAN